ncbi:MAG: putative membrane protein YfcA [Cocleimonas sp.]|jgi:uncharacterized membrane protein YfcA
MDIEFLYIAAALCFAVVVKGLIGFGLPIVALSILSLFIPIEFALVLIVFPIFSTNFVLTIQGGNIKTVSLRFWPLIISLSIGLFLSAQILVGIKAQSLYLVLGSIILFLLVIDTLKGLVVIPAKWEREISLPVGLISGIIGGISTSYTPPIVLFLTALNLPKELFISVLGTILCSGSFALVIAFGSVDILNMDNILWSVLAIIPCILGLWIGGKLRHKTPQKLFYSIILGALTLIAFNLISRGLS